MFQNGINHQEKERFSPSCLARPAFRLLASRVDVVFNGPRSFFMGYQRSSGCATMEGFSNLQTKEISMSTKIVTEADRKRTPRPALPKGMSISTKVANVSRERGPHTHHKKNPGKRHG